MRCPASKLFIALKNILDSNLKCSLVVPVPSFSLERVAYTSVNLFFQICQDNLHWCFLIAFISVQPISDQGEKAQGLFNWIGLETSKKHECNKWCRSSQPKKGRGSPSLSAPRWCSVQVFPPARSHGGPWVDFCTARRGSELFCFAVCTHASKWLCIWLLSPPCPETH